MTSPIYSSNIDLNLTPKGTQKESEMQDFRQQQWHIQPVLCGMGSLRLGSFELDPRSYERAQPFVGGSTETI